MAKKQIIKLRIRSSWPDNLKSDCEYFGITYNQLAKESKISKHRIGFIARLKKQLDERLCFLIELTDITNAFNRIIEERNRSKPKHGFEW